MTFVTVGPSDGVLQSIMSVVSFSLRRGKAMKRSFVILIFLILFAVVFSACSSGEPSESDIQTAIAQTAEAIPTETDVPEPTATTKRVKLPTPTNTPIPTNTPMPTEEPWPVLSEDELKKTIYSRDEISGVALAQYELNRSSDTEAWVDISPDGKQFGFTWFGRYLGDDWLFVESLLVNVDGEVYDLPLCYYNNDVFDSGRVYESFSPCPEDLDDELILNIVNGDRVLVRFDGSEGNYDFELTDDEKLSLEYALNLFHNLSDGALKINETTPVEGGVEIWWEYE